MASWASTLKSALPSLSKRTQARHGQDRDLETPGGIDEQTAEQARAIAPVVWLLGKVQSGKTSIIRALTQSTDAEIGSGFKPCTRTSRIYEFPAESPVLRFLDTRGLGEVGYDATDDIAFAETSAHLILVTMRAMDPQQDAIVSILKTIRKRHPKWPLVVAQTTLHQGYEPGHGHLTPYPFAATGHIARAHEPGNELPGDQVPVDLSRALAYQRTLFANLPGDPPIFVPIDLTHIDDGLEPADYGLEHLTEALSIAAPQSMLAALAAMPGFDADPKARLAEPLIMGHAMAAAGGDLVPFPVAGTLAASTVQARLLHKLGQHYGIKWDKRAYADLSAALGAGTLLKIASQVGFRQLAKMIPVYGQTAGIAASAAASFALTYALGKAAVYYLHRRRQGAQDPKGVAYVYQQSLREAFRIARERRLSEKQAPAS